MAADDGASIALPFTPRPANLNGELTGDVGFDPLNFSEEVCTAVYRMSSCGACFVTFYIRSECDVDVGHWQ